jgi:hypothetical protein
MTKLKFEVPPGLYRGASRKGSFVHIVPPVVGSNRLDPAGHLPAKSNPKLK